jgi:hypothetical protein
LHAAGMRRGKPSANCIDRQIAPLHLARERLLRAGGLVSWGVGLDLLYGRIVQLRPRSAAAAEHDDDGRPPPDCSYVLASTERAFRPRRVAQPTTLADRRSRVGICDRPNWHIKMIRTGGRRLKCTIQLAVDLRVGREVQTPRGDHYRLDWWDLLTADRGPSSITLRTVPLERDDVAFDRLLEQNATGVATLTAHRRDGDFDRRL